MNKKILKDSFLVVDGLSLKGGIHYKITDREEKQAVDGRKIIEYEGKRTIDKPTEYSEAKVFRNKMWRWLLNGSQGKDQICKNTMIGLICPIEAEDKFDSTAKEISSAIARFNKPEKSCTLLFNPVKVLISTENEKVYKALAQSIIRILEDLKSSLEKEEFEMIRHILGSTKGIIPILTGGPGKILQAAFDSCRAQATKIARRKKLNKDNEKSKEKKIDVDTSEIETAIKAFSTI